MCVISNDRLRVDFKSARYLGVQYTFNTAIISDCFNFDISNLRKSRKPMPIVSFTTTPPPPLPLPARIKYQSTCWYAWRINLTRGLPKEKRGKNEGRGRKGRLKCAFVRIIGEETTRQPCHGGTFGRVVLSFRHFSEMLTSARNFEMIITYLHVNIHSCPMSDILVIILLSLSVRLNVAFYPKHFYPTRFAKTDTNYL